jgi:hypothetical protein
LYVGNDLGEVYQLDSRKDYLPSGKYKGITSTVTDIKVRYGKIAVSSMDSYVRIYNEDTHALLNKFYMNKPITSIMVKFP